MKKKKKGKYEITSTPVQGEGYWQGGTHMKAVWIQKINCGDGIKKIVRVQGRLS